MRRASQHRLSDPLVDVLHPLMDLQRHFVFGLTLSLYVI
jgi:hypothetical protein